MRYFKNSPGQVFGYDDADPEQTALITAAITNGWTDVSQNWPPQPVPVLLSFTAQVALNKSDTTVVRCVSAGIAVPAAWQAYRNALRAIVNGTDTTSAVLPEQPAFPSGT